MPRPRLPLILLLTALGCGGEDADGETATAGPSATVPTTVGPMPTAPDPSSTVPVPTSVAPTPAGACIPPELDEDGNMLLLAHESNNYSFTSSLEIVTTPVTPLSNLSIDWSGVTEDFLGNPIDPTVDIESVYVIVWRLTVEQMKEKLNADTLGTPDSAGAIAYYNDTGATASTIYEFEVPGGGELPMDELLDRLDPAQFPPAMHSYTVMPSEGGTPGEGAKMVHAFVLDDTSTNTEIIVNNDSTELTYSAVLTTLTPTYVPAGAANILVDWSDMLLNAMGREFVGTSIFEVLVAKYTETPQELEQNFLQIENIAEEMYRGEVVAGRELGLTALAKEDGTPFAGISADGTWIMALICGVCANPAPWYITLLKPCQ